MPEHIMTRANITAEAMQFEGNQKNTDAIQEWIDEHNPGYVVVWNGHEEYISKQDGSVVEAYPGSLEIYPHQTYNAMPMECLVGDWVVKTLRDTFYTVQKEDFNEIWEVLG